MAGGGKKTQYELCLHMVPKETTQFSGSFRGSRMRYFFWMGTWLVSGFVAWLCLAGFKWLDWLAAGGWLVGFGSTRQRLVPSPRALKKEGSGRGPHFVFLCTFLDSGSVYMLSICF